MRQHGRPSRPDEACATVPATVQKAYDEDVQNKLDALQGRRLGTDYAEMIRSKCAMVNDDIVEYLKNYKCQ